VRAGFKGELWTQDKRASLEHGLFYIHGEGKEGLGKDKIHYGSNSGYQAVNLAYVFGAVKVVLLGFDMQRTGGLTHWHGNHPAAINRDLPVKEFLKKFPALARDLEAEGVEVINATRETALECFKKVDLEEALK
jgi:hypothetical protein